MIFVQRSVLRQFLEPHHLRLGRRGAARQLRRRHQRRQMRGLRPADGLPSFPNQAQLVCYTNERDVIRAYDAATPITTNLMGTFKDLDYFEWAKEMDVVSWGNYPGMDTSPSFNTAMCHDLMRGIGGNKPFMLMEQTRTSRTGSRSASQASRRSAQAELAGHVAWRGHRAVLPDEAVDRRLRTIPWRGHRARWHRTVACLQGDRGARRGTGPHRQADHGIANPRESRHHVRLAKLLVSRRLRRTNRRILLSERSAPLLSRVLATQRACRHHRKHHASRQAQTIRSARSRPPSSPCCRASPKRWNPTYPKAAAS